MRLQTDMSRYIVVAQSCSYSNVLKNIGIEFEGFLRDIKRI